MRCKEIMTNSPKCCVPSDTVARAAKLMKTRDVGAVPVCEDRQGRKLVGIVTDRDLVVSVMAEARDPNRTMVQDVMTREPFACQADDDIETAFDSMSLFQIRRIPVVGSGGELIGIISQADLAIRTGRPEKTAEALSHVSIPAIRAA
jgi:CBS domain-containing protein